VQVKLLRAIQERRVRPIGATQEVPVDCRILSATHRNLEQAVEDGSFRQDLFYRVNVIELKVPALRDRAGDISLLVEHFLEAQSTQLGVTPPALAAAALEALRNYPFPGNVRELENVLERALTLCEGDVIDVADLRLPETVTDTDIDTAPVDAGELQSYLDDVERERILQALEQTRWNKTQAAKLLGISFRALRYRLQKLDLDKP
jgi:two-component system response regulator PilR (NtrC family)